MAWVGGITHQGGISVYGSGYAFGPKNSEQIIVDTSGNTTSSLHIQPQSLDQIFKLTTNTGIRSDGGNFGISGWKSTNYSTGLSSIIFAIAMPVLPTTGLTALASGWCCEAGVAFSGNQLDFTFYHATSGGAGNGGLTSSGTSSKIAWFALGI